MKDNKKEKSSNESANLKKDDAKIEPSLPPVGASGLVAAPTAVEAPPSPPTVGETKVAVSPPASPAPVPDQGQKNEAAYVALVKTTVPFSVTRADGVLGILLILLSYLAVRWTPEWIGYRVSIFTVLYVGVILGYAFAKKIKPSAESWFWMGTYLITGLSFSLWTVESMRFWRYWFMLGVGLYWIATLFHGLLVKKTSNYAIVDIVNLLLVVPFKNLVCLPKSLINAWKGENKKSQKTRKQVGNILIGVLISVPLLLFIVPNLLAADSFGGFNMLFKDVFKNFDKLIEILFPGGVYQIILEAIFLVPVAFYLSSLIYGYAHRRNVENFAEGGVKKHLARVRILPKATVVTVLSIIAGLYSLYVFSQIPYFFSAFRGELSNGYVLHSSYARDGFFQLCWLVVLNLFILLMANLGSKQLRVESKILRVFNIFLSLLTLVLIFTAFSKMMLYINTRGLTVLRVLVCGFLIFLLFVWVAVIVLQFAKFSIMRVAMIMGTVTMCAMCVINIDTMISNYNVDFYAKAKAKTPIAEQYKIPDSCDVLRERWGGASDIDALYKYYLLTTNDTYKQTAAIKLHQILKNAKYYKGSTKDTFAWSYVRNTMEKKIMEIEVDEVGDWYARNDGGIYRETSVGTSRKGVILQKIVVDYIPTSTKATKYSFANSSL